MQRLLAAVGQGGKTHMPAVQINQHIDPTQPSSLTETERRVGILNPPASYQPDLKTAALQLPTAAIPDNLNLNVFREVVGITVPQIFDQSGQSSRNPAHTSRPGPNVGIYQRTIKAEKECKLWYTLCSLLINGCLGLQIVVAAALTALGAGNGPHGLVTAFGAINTVIAGFLTYLKGSGLPNRFRYFASEWGRVREFIEQRERAFAIPDNTLDVQEEVRMVERLYEEVRMDVEANVPDGYVSVNEQRLGNRKSIFDQRAALNKLGGLRRKVEDGLDELGELRRRAGDDRSRISGYDADAIRKETEDEFGGSRRELSTRYAGSKRDLEAGFGSFVDSNREELLSRFNGSKRDLETGLGGAAAASREEMSSLGRQLASGKKELDTALTSGIDEAMEASRTGSELASASLGAMGIGVGLKKGDIQGSLSVHGDRGGVDVSLELHSESDRDSSTKK